MKKFILMVAMALSVSCALGCNISSTAQETKYTEKNQKQSLSVVGFPDITNFFERAQLKEIYEMRDNPNLVMHWYTRNEFTGKWVYEGKCIGYGIPYGASMTNPEEYEYQGATLPLAEPNALYTNGVTTSATWILAVNETGDMKPTYVEQALRVSQHKIRKELLEEFSIPADY